MTDADREETLHTVRELRRDYRRVQSAVTGLNRHGLIFDKLTNGQTKQAH